MAHKTLRPNLPGRSRFERARAQQLDEHGYISCTTAMAAATETLDNKDAEVALMFCWLARDLLGKSEVLMRRLAVGPGRLTHMGKPVVSDATVSNPG
jgi:hypothetical protein